MGDVSMLEATVHKSLGLEGVRSEVLAALEQRYRLIPKLEIESHYLPQLSDTIVASYSVCCFQVEGCRMVDSWWLEHARAWSTIATQASSTHLNMENVYYDGETS